MKRRKRKPHKLALLLTRNERNIGQTVEVRALEKPWLKHMGKLKRLRKETRRINRLIAEDSEKIDAEK